MSRIQCSILIVDDESYILDTLSSLLSSEFEVLTAHSPALAKSLFSDRKIDIILTDQRMPGGTGVQLLEWVRKTHPDTLRLLMTGFAELEEAIEAINRAQVFRYIFKPWKTDDFLEVIRGAARTFQIEHEHKQMHAELKRLNEELEHRVRLRTEQLEEAYEELEQKNKMLEKLALTDPLTGLPNRRAMDRLAERELRRRERRLFPLAIGMADIDHFKHINSRYLLPGGDKVLVDLSRCLSSSLRAVDSLGRVGGEEFLIIAPDTDHKGAVVLGERVRSAVEKTKFEYREHLISVTISIGFSVVETETDVEFEQLRHQASAALGTAKNSGRNRCIVEYFSHPPFEQAG